MTASIILNVFLLGAIYILYVIEPKNYDSKGYL